VENEKTFKKFRISCALKIQGTSGIPTEYDLSKK